MNYEHEHNPGISPKAVVAAILLHTLLLAVFFAVDIGSIEFHINDFVNLEISTFEPVTEKEKTESQPAEIPATEEVITQTDEVIEEEAPLIIEKPVTTSSMEAEYFIDDKYNNLIDSVIAANRSIYGMKRIISERIKEEGKKDKEEPTMIEKAREDLKAQLILLYKDRYGELNPDKYASPIKQNGHMVSIPIPLGPIIDLLKDLF